MATMTVEIPEPLTPEEARLELAIALFVQDKVSFGQARTIAGLTVWSFQQELGKRRIPPHYDVEEFREDVGTLERLGL